MAGAPARRRRPERWRARHRGRVARVSRKLLRQVAAPRRLRFPRRHPPHLRRQIQETRPPRTIRQLEVGILARRAGQTRAALLHLLKKLRLGGPNVGLRWKESKKEKREQA